MSNPGPELLSITLEHGVDPVGSAEGKWVVWQGIWWMWTCGTDGTAEGPPEKMVTSAKLLSLKPLRLVVSSRIRIG